MKRALQLTLGIVTSVGGFLEIGSIATAAQAGAGFGYQLGWAIVLGTICIGCLVEMAGRFSACSKRTIPDAMRERFGIRAFAWPLLVTLAVSLLVLAAEISGTAAAFSLATGLPIPIWTIPVAFGAWALIWAASFSFIENAVSLLGLVTIVFVVAALKTHPNYHAIARGMLPSVPSHDAAKFWFTFVSVLGASISPYLYYFYSSGAIEEKWDTSYLTINRWIAGIGMSFGGLLSLAVLVLGATLFHPAGRDVLGYRDLVDLVTPVLGKPGFWLFVASLGIACVGATLEIALSLAYMIAQGFGWEWGEDLEPRKNARFSLTYTMLLALACIPVLSGIEPLSLTEISMALTAVSLPFGVLPFLILMNDKTYLGEHTNGVLGNAAVMGISILAMVLAIVAIPLQLLGS